VDSWKRTLTFMVVAQFCSALGFSIFYPFLPLYIQTLGSTTRLSVEVLSGLVFSVQAVTMAIASPFWGVVADRFGRKLMVLRATLGGSAIILLMGFARSAEELIALRAIQGVVTGVISAANALIASVVPRERTGYAMGMLQVGLWSGVAAGPLLGGVLSDFVGFRITFVVTAVLLLLAGIGVAIGVEDPFVRADRAGGRGSFLRDWRRVLANPWVDCTLVLRFLAAMGRSMVEPILPLFVLALMATPGRVGTSTGFVVGAASVASTLTAVCLGRIGDRAGHARVALGSALATAICFLVSALVQDVGQLLLLSALTGACVGGLIPSLSALLAEHSESGDAGCVYGIDNSVTSAGRAIGPVLGAAGAVWFSFRGTFVLTGIIFLAAAAVAALTVCRPTLPRRFDQAARLGRDQHLPED
jgi:DHA1 family multidrug resistance protein-like MFS transporter